MTRQQAPCLHLPDGGKIQAAVEFVLPDRTMTNAARSSTTRTQPAVPRQHQPRHDVARAGP